jgi:hypothetical protein
MGLVLFHLDDGPSLKSLAELYAAQSRFNEAEPLYQRALAAQEKALGPDHPDVGTSLHDLAALYQAQGPNRRGRAADEARVRYQRKGAADDPSLMRWSDSQYGFSIEEDCNGQHRSDQPELVPPMRREFRHGCNRHNQSSARRALFEYLGAPAVRSFQEAHFTFSQSRVGREMYGRCSRFDTIPSSRNSDRITLADR